MMKNIYMKLMRMAAVIAVSFSLASCLEKFPGDAILETESMKSLNDAEQILTGIYTASEYPWVIHGRKKSLAKKSA